MHTPISLHLLSATIVAAITISGHAAEPAPGLQRLLEGNARYAAGDAEHPNQNASRRAELAEGQKPFAVVVSCSDSRVSPEILLDQGLGDVFVVRLAGNIVNDDALGSIEFAVSNLGARSILVVGHEKCGAVAAVVSGIKAGADDKKPTAPAGHLGGIISAIRPAAEATAKQPGDNVDNAVRENVRLIVSRLKTSSPVLAPMVESGALDVAGARYDLDDGKLEMITR